jgi:signal transduction histidine kinase
MLTALSRYIYIYCTEEQIEIMSTVSLAALSHLTQKEYLEDIRQTDQAFRRLSVIVVLIWLSLIAFSHSITPPENFEVLEGAEFYSPLFAFMFISLSLLGRLFTALWLEPTKVKGVSGVMIASITVQCIALTTNALFTTGYPVPVMVDPMFGNRVFIYRWCEWTPLAFFMMFITISVDARTTINDALLAGSCQGLSTFMGLLLPYCKGTFYWTTVMVVSCRLFLCLFPTLHEKRKVSLNMERGNSSHTLELYERARLCFQLLAVCSVGWSCLVVMYFLAGVGSLSKHDIPSANLWFIQRNDFSMIWECIMDVILKGLYMNTILKVRDVAFDDAERAERRLRELRRLMNAVWERSSDVICVSVRGASGSISTMVSPVYTRIYHNAEENHPAIIFDIEKEEVKWQAYSNVKARMVRAIAFDLQPSPNSQAFSDVREDVDLGTIPIALDESLLTSLAGMIARAWNNDYRERIMTHRLLKNINGEKVFTSCEANICHLENDAILMVIRDISERSKRFEAEKKMVLETTARKKDAEANRFTRHEVKNGLLAAIGLCESLKESSFVSEEDSNNLDMDHVKVPDSADLQTGTFDDSPDYKPNITTYTSELDKTLKNILNTILSEAMARDVIHGNYEPKMERVDLEKLLNDMRNERFPVLCQPSPLPSLYFDPQLLQYIHRNAVSNACKYGQMDGKVTTRVYYNEGSEILLMEVENLPGAHNDRLLSLGSQASDMVFEPGKRLHDEMGLAYHSRHSAGDGAWIMRKCAETLKGKVGIRFERERTVFSFECPASWFGKRGVKSEIFHIPSNVWGIAIDDSSIQRKLLSKFLSHAGISESRQIIQGGKSTEIRFFDKFLTRFVQQHPQDYFLVIADENLDITESGALSCTLSGSEFIQRVICELSAEEERRILGLVRSANDSSEDIALYNARAHGFISKAPVRNSSVLETIAPLWEKRFSYLPRSRPTEDAMSVDEEFESMDGQAMNDFVGLVLKELQVNVDSVDKLCSQESATSMQENWPFIWEKLHCLKGDLLSLLNNPWIERAAATINSMRGKEVPVDFEMKWLNLRSQISDIVDTVISSDSLLEDTDVSNRGQKRSNMGLIEDEQLNKKPRTKPRGVVTRGTVLESTK